MGGCYDLLLESVGIAADRIGSERLTSHWPLVGGNFDGGVLVIGQAVYGWIPDWTAADATRPEGRAATIADGRSVFEVRLAGVTN